MRGRVSIGLPGALGPDAVAELATLVEAAGFAALWVNDTPAGDSLAALGAVAAATKHLTLATGVIPVDRRPARAILDAIGRAGLPEDRLTIGIGSGQASRGAIDRVREAATELRAGTRADIVVGALGPRMRRLGAEIADGVLLNWLPVDAAARQAAEIRAMSDVRVILYTRTIADEGARAALTAEAARYDAVPQYAANFERLGLTAIDTTLPRVGESLRAGIDAYRGAVDELVLRAITSNGTVDELRAFLAAVSPFVV